MRKILLGTTAVAGAALFAASTAQAQQAPTVRIGGYIDVGYSNTNDNADQGQVTPTFGTGTRRASQQDIRTDAEIVVTVSGKAANGLEYGLVMELEMDALGVSGSSNGRAGAGTGVGTDELYAFISSPTLGTIRFGDEDSAANLMQVRAPTLASAGINGRWADSVNHDGAARYMITGMNDGADRSKIIYLSPQFAGFDFGMSFSPNGGEGERERFGVGPSTAGALGTTAGALHRGLSSTTNEVTAAARYRGTIGGVGLAVGVAASRADAPVAGVTVPYLDNGSLATSMQDPTAIAAGLSLSALGFTVGGEYMTGKFGPGSGGNGAIATGRDNSTSWALGGTYTVGALSLGAFYARATSDTSSSVAVTSGTTVAINRRGDRTQTVIGVGMEYLIAPGLTAYANYANVEDRNLEGNLTTGGRNNGQSRTIDFFIVGMNIAF